MDKELFALKIKQLTDNRLKELLQLRTKENSEIIELAEKEALERGIDLKTVINESTDKSGTIASKKKEEDVNWSNIIFPFLPDPDL